MAIDVRSIFNFWALVSISTLMQVEWLVRVRCTHCHVFCSPPINYVESYAAKVRLWLAKVIDRSSICTDQCSKIAS